MHPMVLIAGVIGQDVAICDSSDWTSASIWKHIERIKGIDFCFPDRMRMLHPDPSLARLAVFLRPAR